jgi:hypothetical protein
LLNHIHSIEVWKVACSTSQQHGVAEDQSFATDDVDDIAEGASEVSVKGEEQLFLQLNNEVIQAAFILTLLSSKSTGELQANLLALAFSSVRLLARGYKLSRTFDSHIAVSWFTLS